MCPIKNHFSILIMRPKSGTLPKKYPPLTYFLTSALHFYPLLPAALNAIAQSGYGATAARLLNDVR